MSAVSHALPVTRGTWAPSYTTTFTVADLVDAFFGFFNKSASHGSVNSWDWRSDQSTLTFWATGTACTVQLGESLTNGFSISVDDGAFTLVGGASGFNTITAFTGLSDSEHIVRIVSSPGFNGGGAYTRAAGDIVTVTGANPAVRSIGPSGSSDGTGWHVFDPSIPGQHLSLSSAAIAGVTPAYRIPSFLVPAAAPQYSYGGATTVKGSGTELWAFTGEPRGRYAVDGATWTSVTFPADLGERTCWRRLATGLDDSTTHIYRFVASFNSSYGGKPHYGIALGPNDATYSTAPTETTVAQFGDSITQGMTNASQYTGNGDTYIVAQALGGVGLMVGKGGQTAQELDTNIDNILDGLTLAAPDVAIIAIGVNNYPGTSEADFKTAYDSIIGKCLAAGITTVLCRSLAPDNTSAYGTFNGYISAVVTARADANVVYVAPTWGTSIDTIDGQHPTATGYIQMAALEESPYGPYL